MALAAVEADTCEGCGGRLSRTRHPEMFGWYEVAYVGECQQCAAIEEHHAAHPKEPNSRRYVPRESDGAPAQADLPPIDFDELDAPQPVREPTPGDLSLGGTEGDLIDAAFDDDTPAADSSA